MLLTTANTSNVKHERCYQMATKREKLRGGFVEGLLSIAVSQDRRVLSNTGRLGKIVFCHLAGK